MIPRFDSYGLSQSIHPSSMNGSSSACVGGVLNAAAGGSVDGRDDEEVTSSRITEAPEAANAFPKSHKVVDVQALRPIVPVPAATSTAAAAGATAAGVQGASENSQHPPNPSGVYAVSMDSQAAKMEGEWEGKRPDRADSMRSKADSVRSRGSRDTCRGGSGVTSVRVASVTGSHASQGMPSSLFRSLADTQDFKQFREADAVSAELAACETATRDGSSVPSLSTQDEDMREGNAVAAVDGSSTSQVQSMEPHAWWQSAPVVPPEASSEAEEKVRCRPHGLALFWCSDASSVTSQCCRFVQGCAEPQLESSSSCAEHNAVLVCVVVSAATGPSEMSCGRAPVVDTM